VYSRKDVPFAVKIATFHTPLSPGPLKGENLAKILDLDNFARFGLKTLEVHGENTPYSSSEPNESDIVNRECGGEKLKYVLTFYIGVHIT